MLTSAAVCAAVYFYCLGITVLLFAFRPDMAQLPSIMADIIMLILYARVFRFSWSCSLI